MWIFDFFLSREKRIQKNQRTLTNRDVQGEDRDGAARWLADEGSPKSLVALLTRFDMNLENQLKDKAEKELVYGLVAGFGDNALRALERHLERCRQVALPMRMYLELKGEEATILKIYELLEVERKKDDFKAQKKIDMLVWLADRRHAGAIEAAAAMLGDFDEGVRYSASEVIIAQQDDAGRAHLQRVLANPAEDSNRLKVRLADVFSTRRWPIDDDTVAPRLPVGFGLRDGRVVAGA